MASVVAIHSLPLLIDQPVTFRGTLRKIRSGKKYSFLEIGYGRHQVQVVTPTSSLPSPLYLSSYISVSGTVKSLPSGVYSALPGEVTGTSYTASPLFPRSQVRQNPTA